MSCSNTNHSEKLLQRFAAGKEEKKSSKNSCLQVRPGWLLIPKIPSIYRYCVPDVAFGEVIER